MDIHPGDYVLVNLAPFIGSWRRHRETVRCRVLAVDGTLVEVLTEFPHRDLSLWVAASWVEGEAAESEQAAMGWHPVNEDDATDELRSASLKGMHRPRRLPASVG